MKQTYNTRRTDQQMLIGWSLKAFNGGKWSALHRLTILRMLLANDPFKKQEKKKKNWERSDTLVLWDRKITEPKGAIRNRPAPPTWLCRTKQRRYRWIIRWQIRQQPTLQPQRRHSWQRIRCEIDEFKLSWSIEVTYCTGGEFCYPAHLAWNNGSANWDRSCWKKSMLHRYQLHR